MKLMFVCYALHHQGSAQDIYNYTLVANGLGHEVVLYGPENVETWLTCSPDVKSADAVIFIAESNMYLHYGGCLNLLRLLGKVPRERRVVIDCDGKYNDAISVEGDYNHPSAASSRWWTEVCDSLSDKICQPTLHPLRDNVRTFFFHAYNPAWAAPLDFRAKEYGMVYVGNNWFRWHSMHPVLRALEPIREEVGRVGLVGHGWDSVAWWAHASLREDAYRTDPSYLKKLNVEVMPPTPFVEAIGWMSKATFNPVIYRPLFDHLRFVTCRTFETPAANTIPLFRQDEAYVREIYGERAVELVLGANASEKILDVMHQPEYYASIVVDIRRHLAEQHSYGAGLQELIEIIES